MPFGRLLPKEVSFFDFFEQHADKCVAASELLLKLVGNLDDAADIAKQIKDVEHDGDKITHNTVLTIPASATIAIVTWFLLAAVGFGK
jgi:uncharacterized protein Yka (UPF0111/DUF47 family)